MRIEDVRVGMWLELKEEKVNFRVGGHYLVIGKRDMDEIVYVNDDNGVKRGLFARRFEPAVNFAIVDDFEQAAPVVAAAPIPRPVPWVWKNGDRVKHNQGDKHYLVDNVRENGRADLQEVPRNGDMIARRHDNWGNGYEQKFFDFVEKENAPEAVLQPAGAAPAAPVDRRKGLKLGDRVRVINPVDKGGPGWMIRMNQLLGQEFIIKNFHDREPWFKLEEEPHDFWWAPHWVELVQGAPAMAPIPVPAPQFRVGHLVVEKAWPDGMIYNVLGVKENGMLVIGTQAGARIGTFNANLFRLHAAQAPKPAEPAIIKHPDGAFVKITKAFVSGPKLKWCPDMEVTIGTIAKVVGYNANLNAYELSNGWFYSHDVLEIAKEADMPKKAGKKHPSLREVISEFRKKNLAIAQKGTPTACYVVFAKDKDGKIEVMDNTRDVCHARLASGSYYPALGQGKEMVGVLDILNAYEKQVEKKYHGSFKKFVDYMVNQSPWSVAYQKKTVKNVLDNGVLLNVDVPAGAVAGACMAMRYLKEFPGNNRLWKILMDEGISGDAAYLTCYALNAEDPEAKKVTIQGMGGGHQALCGMMPAGALISFFANGYDEDFFKGKPYREKSSYTVHNFIAATTDRLKIKGNPQYNTYVKNVFNGKNVPQGWGDPAKVGTREDALAFARLIEEQLETARQAKAKVAA